MKIITWNTGRMYGAKGQRIAAMQLVDGRVIFCDVDRGLEYATAKPCDLTPSAVMACYDYNQTEYYDEPWENTVWPELKAAARAI